LRAVGWAWQAVADGDAKPRLAALAARLIEEQRGLARRFEEAAAGWLSVSAAGAGGGLATAVVGAVRRRRRWPVPIPLAVTGRVVLAGGWLLSTASAASALLDNPAARARRRTVEVALARDEAARAREAAAELAAMLA